MKKVKGFTLIELLIVVAIIGILAAVVIPATKAYVDNNGSDRDNSHANVVSSSDRVQEPRFINNQ